MLSRCLLLGVTQLELLICIACLSLLAVVAVPAYTLFIERHAVQAVGEALAADLRWARSEALKQDTDITVTFTSSATEAWRYVVQTSSTPPIPLKSVASNQQSAFASVALTENFRNHATLFDADRGLTEGKNGTVSLTSATGQFRLKVILGNLGRVRICTDQGDIAGYEAC